MNQTELTALLLTEGATWEYDGKFHVLGGKGSGHFGHAGRPGKRGGSAVRGAIQTEFHILHGGQILEQEIESIREEISSTWEGKRRTYALGGFSAFFREGREVLIRRDGNELVSIAALSKPKSGDEVSELIPMGNYRWVMTAATKRKGFGRRMMEDAIQRAKESHTGLVLISDPEAAGFYRKVGLREVGPKWDNAFYWTEEDVKLR